MITDRINFRQPKYVLPAILYPLLLVTGYLVMDIFDTEVAETPSALQTTEYLNPELPEAQMRDDGIGGKYESMVKSYGRIQDYSAVENIERNNNETAKEDYDSRYSDEDLALLDSEAAARSEELEHLREMQERLRQSAERGEAMVADSTGVQPLSEEERLARSEQRRKEALAELDKVLAEARKQGQKGLQDVDSSDAESLAPIGSVAIGGKVEINEQAVNELAENAESEQVVKKVKTSSDYFNTLAENEPEPRLIKAIIDEDIKAVEGSRVRLRLLDDVEIDGKGVAFEGSPVYFNGNATVRNVTFANGINATGNGSAVYVTNGASKNITFEGCTFTNAQWDAIQLTDKDIESVTIKDCNFRNTVEGGYRYIHLELRNGGQYVANETAKLIITGCTFENITKDYCKDSAITILGFKFDNMTIENNTIKGEAPEALDSDHIWICDGNKLGVLMTTDQLNQAFAYAQ